MTSLDPITLEVVRGYLVSTVLQMRATLIRTSYAPILYEARDFSCGMMTADGELGAMSEDFSGHVFAMALGLNATRAKFGNDIEPGDVLAVNDPYTGGTHLNDIAFYTPFFIDGKLLLYIAVRAHHSDVGGATPGSFSGQDTEIYQEGVRIVPVKLFEKGKLNQALWDVLFANMRLAEEREGDALAMLDTARVAEQALTDLCEKYGTETVVACIKALMDSAEESMRESISRLPDGEYHYEHYMDNGGLTTDPMSIKVKLTIHGDGMTFDFTGSAPQVVGPMNVGIPVTQGGVFVVIKSWLDPKTPVNGGTFRPIEFIIPPGSCLAAQLPAAVGGCWDVYRQLQSAVVGLFSQVIPDDLGAECLGAANHMYVAGYDKVRSRHYILYEFLQGGTHATSDTDGATGSFHYDNGDMACVYATESVENRQPLVIEGMTARVNGESPGRYRSGFGITRQVRVLADNSQLSVMTDRAVIPPWGTLGAYPGSLNSFTVLRGGDELEPSNVPGKVKGFPLQAGDIVLMQSSSGGGVGDPLDRNVDMVRKDVEEDYVSSQRARDMYGVVFENGEVDLQRTEEQRRQIRSQRQHFKLIGSPDDDFDEKGCRLSRLSPAVAGKIGVANGEMIEYISDATAPLRAWVEIADGAPADGVSLGPIGRSILKIDAGEEIWVRRLEIRVVEAVAR